MTQFQKNNPTDSRMEGCPDLFHRIPTATASGPTNKTAVEWHLEVEDIEYDFNLTKKLMPHSQHAKIQLKP